MKDSLSYLDNLLMLQNTGQNVQEIVAAECIVVISKRSVSIWSKNKGDKRCAVDLANNGGHLNSFSADQNSIIFFSVHVIQSVIHLKFS